MDAGLPEVLLFETCRNLSLANSDKVCIWDCWVDYAKPPALLGSDVKPQIFSACSDYCIHYHPVGFYLRVPRLKYGWTFPFSPYSPGEYQERTFKQTAAILFPSNGTAHFSIHIEFVLRVGRRLPPLSDDFSIVVNSLIIKTIGFSLNKLVHGQRKLSNKVYTIQNRKHIKTY